MSRKKGEKNTGESHACEQTREEVWFESDVFFFFQSNLSLVGTEASPFGGNAISSHALPTSQMWIHQRCLPKVPTYCIRRYEWWYSAIEHVNKDCARRSWSWVGRRQQDRFIYTYLHIWIMVAWLRVRGPTIRLLLELCMYMTSLVLLRESDVTTERNM